MHRGGDGPCPNGAHRRARDRRLEVLLGRAVLRMAAAGLSGRSTRRMTVEHDDHGAPVVRVGSEKVAEVSLAHDEAWVAVAAARTGTRVGLDVEKPGRAAVRVLARRLGRTGLDARAATRLWTALESLAKSWRVPLATVVRRAAHRGVESLAADRGQVFWMRLHGHILCLAWRPGLSPQAVLTPPQQAGQVAAVAEQNHA